MKIFDFGAKKLNGAIIPKTLPETGIFIACRTTEVHTLSERFGWDVSTATECVNLDETVRYAGYDGYDFVSLIHMEIADGGVTQREINLFVSKRYLVMVLPEQAGTRLEALEAVMCRIAGNTDAKPERLTYLYHLVFSRLAADYADVLEALEEELEALSEVVTKNPRKDQLDEIERLRKEAYTAKKILRALSYIGDDILMDENAFLKKDQLRYFRSINTRLKKLYDFAASLYELSRVILNVYDSKLAIKMNETVNKLTVITLFFAPLTVITGIYGMNFTHMPELGWTIGYPLSLGIMATVSLIIYLVLKKQKWL